MNNKGSLFRSSTSAAMPVGTVYSSLADLGAVKLPRTVSKRGDCTPDELAVLSDLAKLLGIASIDGKIKALKMIWDVAQQSGRFQDDFLKFLNEFKVKLEQIISLASQSDKEKIKSFFASNMILSAPQASSIYSLVFNSEEQMKVVEKNKLTLEKLNDIAANVAISTPSQGRGF